MSDAPIRLTTSEAMALSRLSRATFWRRIRQGRLPRPVDRARQALFCRDALLAALRHPDGHEAARADVSPAGFALMRRRAQLQPRKT